MGVFVNFFYMISKTSVCVVGAGFVGGSLAQVLSERGITVYNYDKVGKCAIGAEKARIRSEKFDTTCSVSAYNDYTRPVENIRELVESCEAKEGFSGIVFVCLPTPMESTGKADLSIVEGVLSELAKTNCNLVAVVKSTVPPGSIERWNKQYKDTNLKITFSPEFLREATALEDMRNQDRIILGGPKESVNKVKQLFQQAFPNVKIVKTSSTNAELTKYMTNCFLATKLSLANEFYQICQKLVDNGLDVDYDRTVECAKLDKRLGDSHLSVPSFEKDENGKQLLGWGLSCFAKDINALSYVARELGVDPKVMTAAWQKNVEVRPERDWEKLVGRAVSEKKELL
jgi:nucleotide sugar dehydrogenase